MTPIKIRVLRHSAFYSPLLLTMAAGYLAEQGLAPEYDVATPEKTVEDGIAQGIVQVAQSAVAASFSELAHTGQCSVRHFAQINERDGFFLTAREPTRSEFDWHDLMGKPLLIDHFFQPLAMFRYALHKKGINFNELDVIDAGDVAQIDAAYRAGQGAFVHQQGPYAQQLEADGLGMVVACVGDVLGPVAFSSLCAAPDWLETDMARAFKQAYRKGREASRAMPAAEIAQLEAGFFPEIDRDVLTATIQSYQSLGCWEGDDTISRSAYENVLDIFEFSGVIQQRYDYSALISAPSEKA